MTGPRLLLPVLLDVTGLRLLFVGAGEGTATKLNALVDQNPPVRIVAPTVSPQVRTLAARLTDAEVRERPFTEDDLDGISLVYGMTDEEAVNTRLANLCRSRGLWTNVAHHRGPLSFSSPAVARGGGVIVAFSSEEGNPAVAVAARDSWIGGRE